MGLSVRQARQSRASDTRAQRRRAAATLLAACAATATAPGVASAQTAWFSLQGDFNAPGDQQHVLFSTSAPISSPTLFQAVTYANSGGTNFAGDTIAAGGIDSFVEMLHGSSRGFNDDKSASDRDSILTWSPTTPTNATSSPLASPFNPQPQYTLNLRESGNDAAGPWALDLVGPASTVKLTGLTTLGTNSTRSLKFGSDTGTATLNHTVGSFTLQNALVVGQGGNAALNLSGGTITNAGVTTVNAGSTLAISGTGVFNSDGDFNLVGGTLTRGGPSAFNLASGKTFTASANALVSIDGSYSVGSGRTFNVLGGADVSSVGFHVNGAFKLSGAGSTLTSTSSSSFGGSAPATVTIENGAAATINSPGLSIGSGAAADVLVQSGGTLSSPFALNVSAIDFPGGVGTLTITGAGSTVSSSSLRVGSSSNGSGTVNVLPGGTFSGGANLLNTGTVNVAGGTYNSGNLTVTGGRFHVTAGTFSLGANKSVSVVGGGLFDWNLDTNYTVPSGNGLHVTGAGSTFRQSDPVGPDSALVFTGPNVFVQDGGELEMEYLDLYTGELWLTDSTLDATHGQTAGMNHRIAGRSGTARLTLNNSDASFVSSPASTLNLAPESPSSATVSVFTGSTLTIQSLNMSGAGFSTLRVYDGGAAVNQLGNSTTSLGAPAIASSSGTIRVETGGTFSSGTGPITVNRTGRIEVAGGTFNANGDVTVVDGDLVHTSGTFNLAAGKTFSLSGFSANAGFTGPYTIDDNTTFSLSNFASMSSPSLNVGVASGGTLALATNALLFATSTTSTWGDAGGTANVTLSGNASAHLRSLNLAAGNTPSTNATVLIQGGADVSADGGVTIASAGPVGGAGTLTVTGAGSTFVQNSAGAVVIGHATNGAASVNVLAGGTFETSSTGTTTVNATGAVTVNNATLKLKGPLQINAGGTLTSGGASTITATDIVNHGTLTSGGGSTTAASISGSGNTQVTGGTLTVAGGVRQTALSIGDAARLTIPAAAPSGYDPANGVYPAGSNATGSKVTALTILGSGQLDLGNSDMVIDHNGASPLTDVRDLIAAGYNSGAQDGPGIVSSTALSTDPFTFALGYAENADLPISYGSTLSGPLFSGVDADDTAVLIKFTWVGDVTLDGIFDFQDLSIFNGNYDAGASTGRLWTDGDLNYDGTIDFQDLSLFNGTYDPAKPSLPEPASLAVLGVMGVALTRRRGGPSQRMAERFNC